MSVPWFDLPPEPLTSDFRPPSSVHFCNWMLDVERWTFFPSLFILSVLNPLWLAVVWSKAAVLSVLTL
jgi:hypothetical protein